MTVGGGELLAVVAFGGRWRWLKCRRGTGHQCGSRKGGVQVGGSRRHTVHSEAPGEEMANGIGARMNPTAVVFVTASRERHDRIRGRATLRRCLSAAWHVGRMARQSRA
jgi:hypothetical protein